MRKKRRRLAVSSALPFLEPHMRLWEAEKDQPFLNHLQACVGRGWFNDEITQRGKHA